MIDFMVAEAVAVKVLQEDAEARKNAERKAWKSDLSSLREKVNA